MKNLTKLSAIALAGSVMMTSAKAVEIEVGYAYSSLFDVTMERLIPEFNKAHPDITVKFRATYENYEDGTNTILREAVAGDLPDVTFQGLNRQAILVEKGIAKSLEPFIAKEADFAKDGYHQAMLDLGTFNGEVYGLPYSVSLPVGYYNMDNLRAAGITELPTTWDEVIAACKTLMADGHKTPMWWGWSVTGNWFFQALMWSQGEPILKDGKVNFDGAAGLAALEQMKKLYKRNTKKREYQEKVEVDGIKISKKLLNREQLRSCPVCGRFPRKSLDDVCLLKFDCCHKCYS